MHLSQIDACLIATHCSGLIVGGDLKIGGQKRVWRCTYDGRPFVLKALMADKATLRRVKRELRVMCTCNSPHLPKLGPLPLQELKFENGDKILYFLEEYIDGMPLSSVAKPMPRAEVIALGLCITEALHILAMGGYIHRDVKPMNIIRKSSSEFALIDAGLALDCDADAITQPGSVVGTRAYLSPDQLKFPPKQLDIRADLFALGVTMYECATGEHPFLNDEMPRGDVVHTILEFDCLPPQHFNTLIHPELASIILKLLRKDRDERYTDLNALRQDLDDAAARDRVE